MPDNSEITNEKEMQKYIVFLFWKVNLSNPN